MISTSLLVGPEFDMPPAKGQDAMLSIDNKGNSSKNLRREAHSLLENLSNLPYVAPLGAVVAQW
jgi:hypothetical protein